jgi:UMF1 family MFS transporter
MYDWANSAFATIMLAAVFPIFFVNIAGGEGSLGSAWWGRGLALSALILAIGAPIIGAFIEYIGVRKRLFITFLSLGVISLFFLAMQDSWQLLLVGYIFANLFWSAGNIIYDSYLLDVTTKERMDKVSAWGYAMGYIGGSTIPFVFSIILIMFGDRFPIPIYNTLAVQLSILLTAVWWWVFSIPIILNVHHKYGKAKPESRLIQRTFKNILATAEKISKNKGLLIFIIAFFFYIDGVGTVIGIATAYGAELGLGINGMIGALFLTQIVAMPFSILFGRLADIYNSINLIISAILIYICICIVGFIMGYGLENSLFGNDVGVVLFWILAFLVGTVQGGIQATSRAVYGRLIPADNAGEYFGFFEIFGRFAAILGPFLYATVLSFTGKPSLSILSIIFTFVIGLTILIHGKKYIRFEM